MKQKLLLLWLAIMTAITASAYNFSAVNDDGKTIYYYIGTTSASVTYYSTKYGSYSGVVNIPETVTYYGRTYPVTSISNSAFSDCSYLTSVTIPESVTEIGYHAFEGCSGLTSVTIPNSVTSISSSTFSGCTGLTSVTIPNSVTSISSNTFSGCTGLTSVTIPESVTSIGEKAFYGCRGLTEVTIPESVTSINLNAFENCSGLTSVTIPNSVTSISSNTFSGCTGLTSVTIPNSVNSIGQSAFFNCSGLTSVTIPNSVTEIGQSAFYGCSGLTGALTIPNSVTSISSSAFNGCTGLTGELTIPNSVTSIGNSAFYGCRGLTEVTIPNSVTEIGSYAFAYCSGLTGELTIPNSVTSISSSAFQSCSGLTSVTIPNSVNSIGQSAFFNCSGLTSVTIPNSVTEIGQSAFYGCSGLTGALTIPNSVTSISNSAFNGCTGLTGELTIPNSVTSIGNGAFARCSGLTSVTIPNSVTEIGSSAFAYCSGLTGELTIPNSVTEIGQSAFFGCSGLTGELTIPNSVTEIGQSAFFGCSGLTSVTIPNSVTSIGSEAFKNCSGLTEVTIGNSVTEIGQYAFYGCSGLNTLRIEDGDTLLNLYSENSNYYPFKDCKIENLYVGRDLSSWQALCNSSTLKEVTIGNSVTSIGEYSFWKCSGLTEVTIPNSVTSIGNSAFDGCSGLTSVTIGNSVTSIGGCAFSRCTTGLTAVNISDLAAWCAINFSSLDSNPLYYAHNLYLNGELLEDLVIPSTIEKINNCAFYSCSGLTSVTIPNSVTSIGGYAFYGCSGLTGALTIPNSITSIGGYAFYGCSGLTGELTIPNSVTSIGNSAFARCSGLNTLRIEDGDTLLNLYSGSGNYYYYPFQNCKIENLYVGRDLSSWQALCNSSTLKEVTIGNSVTEIGNSAFSGCSGLTGALIIPNSVTSIGGSAFNGCSQISAIKIGQEVSSIGSLAFANCSDLKTAEIAGDVTSISTDSFANSYLTLLFTSVVPHAYGYNGNPCVVPAIAVNDYREAWPDHVSEILTSAIPFQYEVEVTANAIQSDIVEKVNAIALTYNQDLTDALLNVTELKVKGSINSYDVMALHNKMINIQHLDLSEANIVACSAYEYYTGLSTKNDVVTERFLGEMKNLRSVKLPNSATSIEKYATSSVRSMILKRVEIGSGTKAIDDYAFWGNNTIEELILGESVESIGYKAFGGCTALKSITLVPSVNKMGIIDGKDYAFQGCTALNTVNILIQNPIQLSSTFSGCTSLNTVNFQTEGKITLSSTFSGCQSLSNVNISDEACLNIGYNAFSKCTSLKTFNTGNSTTNVGSYAFSGCTGLKNFITGNSLTNIGGYALDGCKSLETIVFGENVNTIGAYAFRNCSSLGSIVIPRCVTTISSYAFDGCAALKNIAFSPGLIRIQDHAFQNCTSLEAAMLPTSLETIGTYAFSGCSSLKELKIPSSIKTIGDYAFQAPGITDIYTWTIEPTDINQNTFASVLDTQALIHVPATAHRLYFYDTKWSKFIYQTDFDEPYEYFYLTTKDLIVDESTVRLKGNPEAELGIGSGLKIAGNDPQNLGNVRLLSNGTHSAAIIGEGDTSGGEDSNLNIDNLTVEIEITKNKWYFFCFPFDIPFEDMEFPGQYAWRWYDGEVRAEEGSGNGAWKDAVAKVEAGKGYIFQGSQNGVLKLKVGKISIGDNYPEVPLQTYTCNNPNDASWNLIGNPFLSYYELCDVDYDSPITIWDGSNYRGVRPGDDEFIIPPFRAFFVQKPKTLEYVGFDPYARETKNQSEDPDFRTAAAMRSAKRINNNSERFLINVELSTDSIIDHTRVVFNEKKSMDYELDCDAAKFYSEIAPQIYTIGFDNTTNYSINERPLADGVVKLGFKSPYGGTFTITSSREDIEMELLDTKAGTATLLREGYTFSAGKGTDNDRFVLRLPQNSGIENTDEIKYDESDDNSEYIGVDGVNYGRNWRRGVMIRKNDKTMRKVMKH